MWGVPSYTFKNNNARAVSFALASHKEIAAMGHSCSIGVTTGSVFCGNVGSLQRRDYVGIGAKVNLAARLMSKSKGDIFIDEETASSIKCLIPNLAKSEGMKLKGYSEIIYAYILTGHETFTLSMKGSVSSTYVQAGVTKQVMTLLNSVSSASRPQGPVEIKKAHVVRSRSHRSLSTSTTDTTFSGRGTDNKATDHSRRSSDVPIVCTNLTEPICFEGGLHEAVYKQMYRELPSPDIEIPDESMCESTPRERLSVVIPNNTEDESATAAAKLLSPLAATGGTGITGGAAQVHTDQLCSSPSPSPRSPRTAILGAGRLKVVAQRKRDSVEYQAQRKGKLSRCMVIEAQSGGGKSAVALLFSSYSSKCAMPSYVVKLKTDDQNIDHCIFRKLFYKLVAVQPTATTEEQNVIFRSVLKLCDWPNRPHIEDRVEALATGLGLREQVMKTCAEGDEKEFNFEEDNENNICVSEIATVLRDVTYYLLGQSPCSVIIEHGHFVDALSWSDLHYLMEKRMAVGILVTARVGSNRDDFSRECDKFGDAGSRRQHTQDFQRSFRTQSSRGANVTPSSLSAKDSQRTMQSEDSGRSTLRRKDGERRRSFEHFFDLEEPEKENKIAYDRAHYTESYDQLISHDRTRKFELPKLEVREIGHLFTVDLHWHEDDIKLELLQKMHYLTHGNAYWCKEVAHFISVSGPESFMKAPLAALGTVVVTKVNEKLKMEQQIIVKAASVIGCIFSIETLKLVVSQRLHDSLLDSIMYLADHNFLTKMSDIPLVYSFPNTLIREILNDLSPPSERSNLHLSIAQQVEGVNGHNLEPYYEL
mgnify:FL=1